MAGGLHREDTERPGGEESAERSRGATVGWSST